MNTKETGKWKVHLLGGYSGVVVNKSEGWERNFVYNPNFDDLQFIGGRHVHRVPSATQRLIKKIIRESVC